MSVPNLFLYPIGDSISTTARQPNRVIVHHTSHFTADGGLRILIRYGRHEDRGSWNTVRQLLIRSTFVLVIYLVNYARSTIHMLSSQTIYSTKRFPLRNCSHTTTECLKIIVVINVRNKIKNVKNAFFIPQNKKKTFVNVIKNVTIFLLVFGI